jgi:hypothetical protein
MRKRLLKFTLLGIAGLALGVGGFALAGTQTLSLTYVGPEPDTITVPWGDTLMITNVDSVSHSLLSSHEELRATLLPHQSVTTMLTGPSRSYSFRQTGGTGFPGKVEVEFSGHVSLRSSSAAVAYGRTVKLSGVASLHGTEVAIQTHRAGQTRWKLLRTVTSGASGAYSTVVRLPRGARVRATIAAGRISSPSINVLVRPRLALSRLGGALAARLTPAQAATRVVLECEIGPGRWKRVASKRPSALGVVTFAVHGRRHTLVRVAVTHAGAADGYAPVSSRGVSAGC